LRGQIESDAKARRRVEAMAKGVMARIAELNKEREQLLAREATHHASREDQERLRQIDHDLQVLWDLRRRELAGERVDLGEDYLDHYDVDPGDDAPDQYR
jgi:Protein of unknown function (DUF2630)